jgi:hypothetical protein
MALGEGLERSGKNANQPSKNFYAKPSNLKTLRNVMSQIFSAIYKYCKTL